MTNGVGKPHDDKKTAKDQQAPSTAKETAKAKPADKKKADA